MSASSVATTSGRPHTGRQVVPKSRFSDGNFGCGFAAAHCGKPLAYRSARLNDSRLRKRGSLSPEGGDIFRGSMSLTWRARIASRRKPASPKKSSAMPSDVRKAFGLPASRHFDFGLRPDFLGQSPESLTTGTEARSASAHQAA